jgi:hypothetical protein
MLLLKQLLAKDPLLSVNSSNYKAFLVYIVGVLKFHFVEVNFAA